MFRKMIAVILLSGIAGGLLGLTPTLLAGRRKRARSVPAVAAPVARAPEVDLTKNYVRHAIRPIQGLASSPRPGLIRIDGAYHVDLEAPWEEHMAVNVDVADPSTGEVLVSRELFRNHLGGKDRGHFPLKLDIDMLPGRYLVHVYAHQLGGALTQLDGSRTPYIHTSIRTAVVVR